jgi:5'-nucleotidase
MFLTQHTRLLPAIPICLGVDPSTGGCDPKTVEAAELVPASFLEKPIAPDRALEALVLASQAQVESRQQRTLGLRAPSAMGRHYEAESALGSFLADSMREMERADVALLNSGGLRADLPGGEVKYGHIYEIFPFDNTVATVTLTGKELSRLLQLAYAARKGVFQISGLEVKLSSCPGRDRLRQITLPGGQALHPERKYKVVMPDFLARGGDGLGPALAHLPPTRVDLGAERPLDFRDSLVAHWQRRKKELVVPKPGRIAFLEETACQAPVSLEVRGTE